MNNPLIINIFGGPGIGKTTLAMDLYNDLFEHYSERGKNKSSVGLVNEVATMEILYGDPKACKFQPYITGRQQYKQLEKEKTKELVITDSPILLGIIYDKEKDENIRKLYKEFLIYSFLRKYNYNILLNRKDSDYKKVKKEGRITTSPKILKEIDEEIRKMLENIFLLKYREFYQIGRSEKEYKSLLEDIKKQFKKHKKGVLKK